MAQATLPQVQQNSFGATARKDLWWLAPLLTFGGLLAFVIYATVRAFMGNYFEIRNDWGGPGAHPVAPYLSPFYSPLLFDDVSPHAWYHARPLISAALLILWGPVLFRFTCYYYRKAYYRAFWLDPPACGVGEPRKSYWGERYFPLILQNIHRYTLYIAIVFLIFLWYDVFVAFWWHTSRDGVYHSDSGQFGIGVGTLIMLANILLLTGFTLGCNSMRHLVGGQLDCFSCPARNGHFDGTPRPRYRLWQWVTKFNNRHMEWAWLSLFSVGFTDFYIMMCSMRVWTDLRLL
jgi:hypothetical protein